MSKRTQHDHRKQGRRSIRLTLTLVLAALALPTAALTDTGVPPAPPSVGATVPSTYFGPMPSSVRKTLVGPVQLLRSGKFDAKANTITLPPYRGQLPDGRNVWYILTDTSDHDNADALGLNFSSKLAYSSVARGARTGTLQPDTSITFAGGIVDFSPERTLVPGDGAKPFPPKVAQPGSIGDSEYSPLVRIINLPGTPVYNAPMVAFGVDASKIDFCNGNVDHRVVHDRVVAICPRGGANGGGTVTLKTTPVFSFARPALYISTESSDPVPATLDEGTWAPALSDIKIGRDDSAFSAIERLFVTINGPTGTKNPQRQGLNSALTDKAPDGSALPPLQLIGGIPTLTLDYSPLWDLNLGEWTQTAIDKGYRSRLIDEFQLLSFVQRGFITGPNGTAYGSTGIIVNCPIVFRFL